MCIITIIAVTIFFFYLKLQIKLYIVTLFKRTEMTEYALTSGARYNLKMGSQNTSGANSEWARFKPGPRCKMRRESRWLAHGNFRSSKSASHTCDKTNNKYIRCWAISNSGLRYWQSPSAGRGHYPQRHAENPVTASIRKSLRTVCRYYIHINYNYIWSS